MVATPSIIGRDWKLGFISMGGEIRENPLPWGKAVAESGAYCRKSSTLIFQVLGGLFTNRVNIKQLSGPIGIARMTGEALQTKGYQYKFGYAAAISINLGILNLLPFPILDGGLILLLLIESGLRHDISLNVKERIYQAAFVVLVVFFAFVMFNDAAKLSIFNHVKP
jgi:regulator of sigma E protease